MQGQKKLQGCFRVWEEFLPKNFSGAKGSGGQSPSPLPSSTQCMKNSMCVAFLENGKLVWHFSVLGGGGDSNQLGHSNEEPHPPKKWKVFVQHTLHCANSIMCDALSFGPQPPNFYLCIIGWFFVHGRICHDILFTCKVQIFWNNCFWRVFSLLFLTLRNLVGLVLEANRPITGGGAGNWGG